MSDPLGVSTSPTREPLQRFVSREISEVKDPADQAEIARCLARTTRPANAAFLATLLPQAIDQELDDDDITELRGLVLDAERDGNAAEIGSHLGTGELPQASADVKEAMSLRGSTRRVRGLLRMTAARLAASDVRESSKPAGTQPSAQDPAWLETRHAPKPDAVFAPVF